MYQDTPIEDYKIKGQTVYVKREDLCTADEPDAPLFLKSVDWPRI